MDVVLCYWSDEDDKVEVRYSILKLQIKEELFGCLFFCFLKLNIPIRKKLLDVFITFCLLKYDRKKLHLVSRHESDIANLYCTVCELVIYLNTDNTLFFQDFVI